MRILNIRFRNLNSLAGEWEIDLTHEKYRSSGLFAITGPTGAGKSTILDAICLALYGSTPRLGRISKSSNEIMSRRTSDCMAEVSFETGGVIYRSCWKQHRAHRKPDGELQQPRHELFKDGISQAVKLTDVSKEVEKVTGLTFERFLQSTMLAQGRFASFLLADSAERAPLLEQITRTEIYSDISKHIFQRCKAEQEELALLDSALSSYIVLSDEEEHSLRQEETALTDALTLLGREESRLTTEAEALNRLQVLRIRHDQLMAEQMELKNAQDAFAPRQSMLDTARRALRFSAPCAAHLAQKKELMQDSEAAQQLSAMLPPLQEEAAQQRRRHETAQVELQEARASYLALQEVLKPVRIVDAKLTMTGDSIKQARAGLEQACSACEEIKKRVCALGQELSLCQKSADDIEAWISAHSGDAQLLEEFAVMQNHAASMDEQLTRVTARRNRLSELENSLTAKEKETALCRDEHEKQRLLLLSFGEEIDSIVQQQDHLLDGQKIADWQNRKEKLFRRASLVDKIEDILARQDGLRRQLQAQQEALRHFEINTAREKAAFAAGQEALTALGEQRKVLERSLRLLEKIRSYEEERKHLQDGSPCPLCGALHHPYAVDAMPEPEETYLLLQNCERTLEERTQEQNACISRLATLESNIASANSRKRELEHDLAQESSALKVSLAELSPYVDSALNGITPAAPASNVSDQRILSAILCDDDGKTLASTLSTMRKDNQKDSEAIELLLREHSQLEEKLTSLRSSRENALGHAEKAQQMLTRATHELAIIQEERKNTLFELERENSEFDARLDALRLELLRYGLIVQEPGDVPPALTQLAERRERFITQSSEKETLERKLVELNLQYQRAKEQESSADQTHRNIITETAALEERFRELTEEREQLFGQRQTEQEEKEVEKRIKDAEELALSAASLHEQAQRTESDTATRCAALQKRITERAPQLDLQEHALLQDLGLAGFSSIQNCLDACLSEQERQQMEGQERMFLERTAQLEATLEQNKQEIELAASVSASELPEVEEQLRHIKDAAAEKRELLGALRQRLEHSSSQKVLAGDPSFFRCGR
ncbi:MAG: AAA family ATPase [Mailhella sp.]|nr:AAA family ATPase [Mailhella sp.]